MANLSTSCRLLGPVYVSLIHHWSYRVSICRGDPTKNAFFVERELRGINRLKAGADRPGTQKSALPKAKRFKLDKRLSLKENIDKIEDGDLSDGEKEPVRKKRRYMTADLAIGLQDATVNVSDTMTRARVTRRQSGLLSK